MTDNLVRLRPGQGDALVCVHAASGLVTGFRRLEPHLTVPGPVLALECVEPDLGTTGTIQSVARSYWDQVRTDVGRGLSLVGWSFGGPVAVEMAALAEAAGHDVGVVVLLDAASPELLSGRDVDPVDDLAALFEVDPRDVPQHGGAATVDQALQLVATALAGRRPGIEVEDLRPFAEVYAWHLAALRASAPLTPCRAPAVLVRAAQEEGWADAPVDLGWTRALGRPPELCWTDGTHHTVMAERHAPSLAALLSDVLRAREPGRRG